GARASRFGAGKPRGGADGVGEQRQWDSRSRGGGGQQAGDAGGGGHQPTPGQALPEPLARLGQPRRHRPGRTAQDPRGFLVRFAFEVTQYQGSAGTRGWSLGVLFKGYDQVARTRAVACRVGAASCGLRLALLAPDLSGAGAQGKAVRDLVQPTSQPLVADEGWGLARQDEESSLEGILGAMHVVQHA